MALKSLNTLKSLLKKRAAVGKQILAVEKKLISEAEAVEKQAKTKPKAAKKPSKPKARKPAAKPLVKN